MDLDQIALVNESDDPRVLGDLSIFPTIEEACSWLEHWWVEDNEGLVLTANGARVVLRVVSANNTVVAAGVEPYPQGAELARSWLESSVGLPNAATMSTDALVASLMTSGR
jgi:hypothetical protein